MLELTDVSKSYGEVRALDGVSAQFYPGEIHAVLGENGAGKSTLASIVSGFVTPDKGIVALDGTRIPPGKPLAARARGIEMIHQHFALVPAFTVKENLALARLRRLKRRLDLDALSAPALRIAAELGWSLDPNGAVRSLSVGMQQRLEILKALAEDAKVILFDEPTAVLTREEVSELQRVLRRLREEGRIVVLIAHKLSEVMTVADRVTVLRKGSTVAEAVKGEFDEAQLAAWMVGEMPASMARRQASPSDDDLIVEELFVKGDRGDTAVQGISFRARGGEIFGIGGVDGNGQLELAEALAGVRTAQAGHVKWSAENVAYIPQDRRRDGLALGLSIADNMLVSGYRRPELARGPFLKLGPSYKWAQSLMERFSVQAPGPSTIVSSLSGGNQQKVVVSRNLDSDPPALVVSGPGRGLDIQATAFVHEQILNARDRGCVVVLFSTDLDELLALSDRVTFMSQGRFVEGTGAEAVVGGTAR